MLPSTQVFTHQIVFKDQFQEQSKKITAQEANIVKQAWRDKEHFIEVGSLTFSWMDIRKIEELKYKNEDYNGATFNNLPLGDLAAKIEVDGQSVLLRHFWKKSVETQQIVEKWYSYFLDGKEVLVPNEKAEQAIRRYMDSAIGEVELGRAMFSDRQNNPCFAFLLPGA